MIVQKLNNLRTYVQGFHDYLQHRCIKSKIVDRASVYHIKACDIVKKLKRLIIIGKVIKDQRKETFKRFLPFAICVARSHEIPDVHIFNPMTASYVHNCN